MIEYFHDEEYCFIVMELLDGGNLLSRLLANKRVNEHEAANYMR